MNDTNSTMNEAQDLVMKTKASIDVVCVKTGRKLEEIMNTRGKALVLKCDEEANPKRVKCVAGYGNERK